MKDIRQVVKHVIVRADRERSVLIGQENVYQVGYGAVLVLLLKGNGNGSFIGQCIVQLVMI